MSNSPVLLDIGSNAYAHQAQVDEVKKQIGISHPYFDCWIYGFLENKNFNIDETVAKLKRREEFEKTQLAQAEFTEWMFENMQKGIIQVIGNDKAGRVTFYIVTSRDKPSASRREETRRSFDLFVSYGTRLRPESKRCQMAMLINQDKASMWGNVDMSFQAEIALRIAKFYPGCVDKMYVCKMGRALSAIAKPIFSRLPSIVSDRIEIITENDIKNGKLLNVYDEHILPIALGGKNDCDNKQSYMQFACTIKQYSEQLREALCHGQSVKEWELNNLRNGGYIEEHLPMEILKHTVANPSTYLTHELESMLTYPRSADEMASMTENDAERNAATSSTALPLLRSGSVTGVITDHNINNMNEGEEEEDKMKNINKSIAAEQDIQKSQTLLEWSVRSSTSAINGNNNNNNNENHNEVDKLLHHREAGRVSPERNRSFIQNNNKNNNSFTALATVEDADNDLDLFTCEPVANMATHTIYQHHPVNSYNNTLERPLAWGHENWLSSTTRSFMTNQKRDLFTDLLGQFAVLESFFRISLEEVHQKEWLVIIHDEVEERKKLHLQEVEIHSEVLLKHLPPVIYIIAKGLLWLCLIIMSFYFLLASLFIVILGANTLTYLFFAMFSQPYHVFLYGVAFIVTAAQFALLASRGFDMAHNVFHFRLIQAFRAFGSKALLLQISVCVVCVLIYFIVFCVTGKRYGALTGMQESLAIGWFVAACLILLYHFVFAFGFRTITRTSYAHGSRVNNAETTLYLFMNLEVDEEEKYNKSALEILLPFLLAACAFGFGLCYMCGGTFFFMCACVVTTFALMLLCSVQLLYTTSAVSSSIMICTLCYSCVFWMATLFTMARYGWNGTWRNSLIASMCVIMFCLALSLFTVFGPSHRGAIRNWLFRLVWFLMFTHFVVCDIILLVQNYKMGLFVLALGAHLILTNFRTNEGLNMYGLCTITFAFTAAILACCLLGHAAISERYHVSVSNSLMPSYGQRFASMMASTSATQLSSSYYNKEYNNTIIDANSIHLNPNNYSSINDNSNANNVLTSSFFPTLCLARFPAAPLDVLGMALFVKLGFNVNQTAQEEDLHHWFPTFHRIFTSHANEVEIIDVNVFRQELPHYNTTVITVRPSSNLQSLIESMAMWIDVYTVSFFTSLTPSMYREHLERVLTFASKFAPMVWQSTIQQTSAMLEHYLHGEGNITHNAKIQNTYNPTSIYNDRNDETIYNTHDESDIVKSSTNSSDPLENNYEKFYRKVDNVDQKEKKSSGNSSNEYIYVVGHGPTGTLGALITLTNNWEQLKSLVLSPTQVLYLTNDNFDSIQKHTKRLAFLQNRYSIYNPWSTTAEYSWLIPCAQDGTNCDNIDTYINELSNLCYSADGEKVKKFKRNKDK